MQGMTNLSPRRLQKLLAACKSVKVKRLFFFFAHRHSHAWLKPLKTHKFDLDKGKRILVKGGKLDQAYQIIVPEDLNGRS
jgi:Transcriptional regulator, AbiEi antitoxin, Type IV TA system